MRINYTVSDARVGAQPHVCLELRHVGFSLLG